MSPSFTLADQYDNRMRGYDAATGRFLTPDPLGLRASDMNLYRYVGNDAVNYIDPLGLSEVPVDGKPKKYGNTLPNSNRHAAGVPEEQENCSCSCSCGVSENLLPINAPATGNVSPVSSASGPLLTNPRQSSSGMPEGRFPISKPPIHFAAGDANLSWYAGNQPTAKTDPSGLTKKEKWHGYEITREGHHVVPAELWREFNFDPSAAAVWDREDNRVGINWSSVEGEGHNRWRHGDSGYTGHVRVEMNTELKKFMDKNKITDGKLTIAQQKMFAEEFANHVKHNTENKFIKGFNEAIEKGGLTGLKDWTRKIGDRLPKPVAIKSPCTIKGVAKFKLLKGAGKAIIRKGGTYVIAPMFGLWAYNEARANGASPEEAAILAAGEVWAPPGASKEELEAIEKKYRDTVENAARLGRGIGDPESLKGTLLGPGFIRGRQIREDLYRELGVDKCDLNIYGEPRGKQ